MINTGGKMKKFFSMATLAALSLLPAATWAYTAPTVGIVETTKDPTASAVLNDIIGWILLLVGGIAVLFIIWGGIQYVTSSGNKDKAEQAKKTLLYAVIGLIVIVLADVIVNVVTTNVPSLLNL
jgi:protein-S-isoprenylcysteine O-methyltransferase Ste14